MRCWQMHGLRDAAGTGEHLMISQRFQRSEGLSRLVAQRQPLPFCGSPDPPMTTRLTGYARELDASIEPTKHMCKLTGNILITASALGTCHVTRPLLQSEAATTWPSVWAWKSSDQRRLFEDASTAVVKLFDALSRRGRPFEPKSRVPTSNAALVGPSVVRKRLKRCTLSDQQPQSLGPRPFFRSCELGQGVASGFPLEGSGVTGSF